MKRSSTEPPGQVSNEGLFDDSGSTDKEEAEVRKCRRLLKSAEKKQAFRQKLRKETRLHNIGVYRAWADESVLEGNLPEGGLDAKNQTTYLPNGMMFRLDHISRGYITGDDTPHEPQVRMMLAGGGLGNSAVASSASASSGVSTANTNAVNDEVADATTINEVEDANVAKEEVDASPVDCQSRVSGVKAVRG